MTTVLERHREELVLRHVAAENARDLDAVMATFTHPRYEIIPTGAVFDGAAAVRAMLVQQWTELPLLRYSAASLITAMTVWSSKLAPLRRARRSIC